MLRYQISRHFAPWRAATTKGIFRHVVSVRKSRFPNPKTSDCFFRSAYFSDSDPCFATLHFRSKDMLARHRDDSLSLKMTSSPATTGVPQPLVDTVLCFLSSFRTPPSCPVALPVSTLMKRWMLHPAQMGADASQRGHKAPSCCSRGWYYSISCRGPVLIIHGSAVIMDEIECFRVPFQFRLCSTDH